jgi:hypothetical protein
MLEKTTHTRPTDRSAIIIAGLVGFIILAIVALVWTSHERDVARNDPRAGTTGAISPKNPVPAPGGGADKRQ